MVCLFGAPAARRFKYMAPRKKWGASNAPPNKSRVNPAAAALGLRATRQPLGGGLKLPPLLLRRYRRNAKR